MRFAVILSGCGVRDGSEIHEAVSALLSIDMSGHSAAIFAPDRMQTAVVNGLTGRPMSETRNILVEAARIARGQISALSQLDISSYDAIVLPGGFGAATNLCDFAAQGASCRVDPELEKILNDAQKSGLILGFMCIAPVIAARVFGDRHVSLTVGNDAITADACEQMGARHVDCSATQACTDAALNIVTTPAYMLANSITECFESARALIREMENLFNAKQD